MLTNCATHPVFKHRVPLVADEKQQDCLDRNQAENLCNPLTGSWQDVGKRV